MQRTPVGCRLHLRPLAAALALAVLVPPLRSDPDAADLARTENLQRVESLFAERTRQAGTEAPHLLVRRGLIADRKARTLTVDAEATGLKQRDIVEFLIIAENSGHDYEGLFTAFARPSDISAAIEFIGVPRGRPASPSALAFWPKGERVRVSVGKPGGTARPIEELVLDVRSDGEPLPALGFIHAGSVLLDRDGEKVFAADGDGPGSVASSYNETTTVLDMPRQAVQGEVYERFLANPESLFGKGEFVQITITPETRPPEHPLRVVDLTLHGFAPEGSKDLAAARFRLLETGQTPDASPAQPLAEALRAGRAYLPDRDPYVTLDLDDSLSLQAASDLARVLHALDNEDGLRLEAPRPGQLYYKAFMPQSAWRDRLERPSQPCELRFARTGEATVAATLVRIKEIWSENPDNWRPDLKIEELPVPTPEDLPALLAASDYSLPVLLVFAPGDLSLGEIMPFLRTVQATHSNLHLFTE